MTESAITAAPIVRPARPQAVAASPRPRRELSVAVWLVVAVALVAGAVAIVAASGMRPGYDAFGWLVWGHQILHGSLNTDGAPSWKPFAFLFTLPYALAGDDAQMWLWMITSTAGSLAGAVFGARIAYRLTARDGSSRAYAPVVAGAFAAAGVLGLDTYSHLVMIASSDPIMVTLCLAAIDFHISGRPRAAFAMLVLTSLGRPEAWVFAGLYAIWGVFGPPRIRFSALVGLVVIPIAWFSVPALTAKSWFISGDLALSSVNAVNVIHGNKIVAVFDRFRDLSGVPVQIAALVGIALAALRRDRATLGLAAAALLWVVIEIAMAYHGWSGANRYLLEPAGVMAVVAATAVGRVLGYVPAGRRKLGWATAAVTVAIVVAFAVSLVPTGRDRVQTGRSDVTAARFAGTQIKRLQAVIRRDGGARAIRACGQPVTLVGLQSKVAWATGLNVGNVGYKPGRSIDRGLPIVFFKPHQGGWQVRPIHMAPSTASRCDKLKTDSAFG